jgi:succinoglycan biosynthesis transport protein ExoP
MSNNLPIEPDDHAIVGSGYNSAIPRGVEVNGNGNAPLATGAPSTGAGLGRYFSTLLRYKWWALLILALGIGAGMLVGRLVQPTYLVQSKIWFDGASGGARGPIQEGQLLSSGNWVELLRSYAVLDEVVQSQRLYIETEPENKPLFASFQLSERFRPGDYRLRLSEDGREYILETKTGAFIEKAVRGDSLGKQVGFAWQPPRTGVRIAKHIDFTIHRPRDGARELGKKLVTNMAKNGSFMQIELRGTDPVQLAATLNALVNRFVQLAAELKASRLTEFATILGEQLRIAEQNLAQAEIALESKRVTTITQPTEAPGGLAAGTSQTNSPLTTTFVNLKLQQEQLAQDREALERATQRARGSAFSPAELEVIPAVQSASELRTALAELATKRAALRTLEYRYTAEHPDVRRAVGEIQVLERETIPAMVNSLVGELRRREAQVQGRIDLASREMQGIPPRVMEEARLNRQISIADNLYTMLRQRHEEARLAALSSTPDVKVVDQAAVPFAPVKDERARILMLAVAASLALIVAGVFMADKLDPRVRYPEEVTHGLRLPILAAIPRLKTRNGAVAATENTTHVIEAFRTLRLSVLQARGEQSCFVAAITSPGTGDGKSFVAMNLAAALADQGYRTLLIDGDNRRGGLHRLVSATRIPGLMEVLAGTATIEQAAHRTPYPLLDLIPCGERLQTGPELLGSPAMAEMLKRARGMYSVILIDSPPLGAGVDPFVLGIAAQNMMLVLRTGQTDREYAEAKLSVLDRLPVRLMGAVLNGVPAGGAYRYYGYLPGYESVDERANGLNEAALPLPG